MSHLYCFSPCQSLESRDTLLLTKFPLRNLLLYYPCPLHTSTKRGFCAVWPLWNATFQQESLILHITQITPDSFAQQQGLWKKVPVALEAKLFFLSKCLHAREQNKERLAGDLLPLHFQLNGLFWAKYFLYTLYTEVCILEQYMSYCRYCHLLNHTLKILNKIDK